MIYFYNEVYAPRFFMPAPLRNIAIACNPSHGNERALRMLALVEKAIGNRMPYTVFAEAWPSDWSEFTEAWIIGGDGTLNYFINQYPDITLPLTVFAGGSGNDFHWMMYGNISPEDQVEVMIKGSVQKVDAGICNGILFLNGVGIGFDGAIVKDLLGKKKLAGKASYLLSILKNIAVYQEKPCFISTDGEEWEQDCFMISIANGKRYGGDFLVAPEALLNDAKLDCNIVGSISPLKRLRYLPVIEKGAHIGLPFIIYRKAEYVTIKCPVPLHAHLDGEYLQSDFFSIRVLPEKFSFLC
jgi:diacylglycerol kinase (ATP)